MEDFSLSSRAPILGLLLCFSQFQELRLNRYIIRDFHSQQALKWPGATGVRDVQLVQQDGNGAFITYKVHCSLSRHRRTAFEIELPVRTIRASFKSHDCTSILAAASLLKGGQYPGTSQSCFPDI